MKHQTLWIFVAVLAGAGVISLYRTNQYRTWKNGEVSQCAMSAAQTQCQCVMNVVSSMYSFSEAKEIKQTGVYPEVLRTAVAVQCQ